jgi:predicted lysophospholipase L1 biosynthesis ABC-type transport system permease subunit
MYWKYATRSLIRGGQRTLLAIFCVAVGVMAIVALQLVGNMVNEALTGNVREGNGGDLSVRTTVTPLTAQQVGIFDQLKANGTLTDYTAIVSQQATTRDANGQQQFYSVNAVDPATFPLAGAPVFTDPSDGSLSGLLHDDTVVVTDALLTQLHAHKGDTLNVNVSDDGRIIPARIGGVIATAGYFNGALLLVSLQDYQALPSSAGVPVTYNAVFANVPGDSDANEDMAKTAIEQALPQTTVTTTKDALQQNQQQVGFIRNFLQIVGLLALLIGGVGIINTMQVLLRRRRIEIAMLKTMGYERRDLYALFGLEAALLGLLGGIVGALGGVGISFLVKGLVERALFLHLPATIDPVTVLSGVAIGFFTALIFGLMPIVQSSRVRPLAVLRELPEGRGVGSVALSIALAALLAALFFLLAWSILQNLPVALGAVVGTGVFLFLLGLVFGLVIFVVSKLPVLESFRWWYLLLVGLGVALSALITFAFPALGVIFLLISLLGIVVVLLPRTWKASVKMALRNIGRTRTRTVTTLVALFIGIFSIGLILALGQNIKDQVNQALNTFVTYNSYVIVGSKDKSAVETELAHLSGVKGQVVNSVTTVNPVSVDGVGIGDILRQASDNGSATAMAKGELLAYLSAPQGFDLAHGSPPQVTIVKGANDSTLGSNLSREDAGTPKVLLPQRASLAPLHLKLGSQITLVGQDGKTTETVTVAGFYSGFSFVGGGMYGDNSLIDKLSGGQEFYVYSLILDPRKATAELNQIQQAVPAAQTLTLADFALFVTNFLNNLIVMLTALASLAMIAGIIIIANAVALAMLERRRELGILKAIGHTSQDVLGEVLVENGTIGFIGGLLAMLLVTFALTVLGKVVFKVDFGVGAPITIGIIVAAAVICMAVAAGVAWSATRVRPLEVLRYE